MIAPQILQGDCRAVLPTLADESVHCVVTSPPYWGLRDYGTARWEGGDPWCDHLCPPGGGTQASGLHYGNSQEAIERKVEIRRQQYRGACSKCGALRHDEQIGLEPSPEEHIEALLGVFREVRRVLRKDGTLWVNYGDCYATTPRGTFNDRVKVGEDGGTYRTNKPFSTVGNGLKPKDLCGMPWRLALALQADGWWLRSDIIWSKVNPMPSSVTDRPAMSHEYVFLLTKAERYFYDADAVREKTGKEASAEEYQAALGSNKGADADRHGAGYRKHSKALVHPAGRNCRSVWSIATQPTPDAHFATFPEALVKPCILAGTSEKGCCPACGAPWRREVEKGELVPTRAHYDKQVYAHRDGHDGMNQGANRARDGHRGNMAFEKIEKGWSPTCTCAAGDPVPCTVMDIFGGSGTVGKVAAGLGRRSILIELNPKYVAIARKKNSQQHLDLL